MNDTRALEQTATDTFEFLSDLPQAHDAMPEEVRSELDSFMADQKEHDGLIPSGTVPALLGVSQQRWSQLKNTYDFWSAEHFEKVWYSRRQIEDFYKVRRGRGRPASDVAGILKSLLKSGE